AVVVWELDVRGPGQRLTHGEPPVLADSTKMPLRAGPGRDSGQSRGGRSPMIARQIGQCFAAEVEGVNMAKPLSRDDVAAIHAAMDRYAVLVFHDQDVNDEQQLAFTRSLGDIE